jgi:type IV pilus assembly protein PilA
MAEARIVFTTTRQRLLREESGFTLLELLVVMLILGILAAIAIAAFGSQESKAKDANAKETAHTALVAMQTCATEANDGYASCKAKKLREIEPTLPGSPTLKVSGLGEDEFKIVVQSEPTTQTFTIEHEAKSGLSFTCKKKNTGTCPSTGLWG